ncbi:MAG: type I DNA topoisomerase [Bdellovibrionales bacterium]
MKKKKLVIVESPTKAKTIKKFLDSNYIIESCMGHIRDLPETAKNIPEKYKKKAWKSLGVDTDNDFEPIYCIPDSKTKIVSNLKTQLKQASELILATDEDREGESISWHLQEILKPKVPIKRMVFHEITKEAIQESLKNFRDIDMNLVQAQEARRILDRLVGYTISPLLWKKITRGLSAGRVQSMAVKIISEREMERFHFVKAFYSSLEALFSFKNNKFSARLSSYQSQKIAEGKDFNDKGLLKNQDLLHLKEKAALQLEKKLKDQTWEVSKVDKKKVSRSPKPPFITSTLQQAAYQKLNLSARQTMSFAQRLYENGLITYMRTDSTHLSSEALKGIRTAITSLYGKQEVHDSIRHYKTKSKGAQEAHEAIRPAGRTFKAPEQTQLTGQELRLYQLIWQRTLACQMKNCEQEQTQLTLSSALGVFSASGTVIVSPGFYQIYQDHLDKKEEAQLPKLKKGDVLKCDTVTSKGHETKSPAHYNESSLIQKLEKEGIGRPSTYAPIISTIQNRGYIKKVNKSLVPTFTALAVTQLLSKYLPNYVDLKFTSEMEDILDDIALGKADSKKYLSKIYKGKSGLKNLVEEQEKQIDSQKVKSLSFKGFKDITFHIGRFGAYISQKQKNKEITASLPEEAHLSSITLEELQKILKSKNEPTSIGIDPKTKNKILVKTGRYGPYLELEGADKRSVIPKFIGVESLTLKQAILLLELPKVLGKHPETKNEVKKSIGRFGPYIVHDGDFRSVPSDEAFLSLDLKEALEILKEEKKRGKRSSAAIKTIDYKKSKIKIMKGKYSPYISYKSRNYRIPSEVDPEGLDLEESLKIIEGKSKSPKTKVIKKPRKKVTKKKKSSH